MRNGWGWSRWEGWSSAASSLQPAAQQLRSYNSMKRGFETADTETDTNSNSNGYSSGSGSGRLDVMATFETWSLKVWFRVCDID